MTVRLQKMSTALQNKWRVSLFTICQSLLNGSQDRTFGLVQNMPSQTPGVWWTMEITIHTRQECASQRQEHTGAGIRKTCMWNSLLSDHKASITPKPKYGGKLLGPKTVTQPKWNKVCNFCDRQELTWLSKSFPKPKNKWQWCNRKMGRKYENPSYMSRI